ncbi:MAG: hypothetical protein AAGF53_18795 [Pseudomonadota bacterium]
MTELAPIIGVSTTLISAACKEHCVPAPPRGYWSKVRAGKPKSRIPLPTRPPGMSDCIRIGRPRSDLDLSRPKFEMSIDDLRVQVFSAVRIDQPVPTNHGNPTKRIKRTWRALSNALADFGGVVIPKLDDPTSAIIQIYHQNVFVDLEVCGESGDEQKSETTPSLLMLNMSKQVGTKEPAKIWKDAQDAALETKLQEIITEIVVLAEIKERDAQTARYAWQVAQLKHEQTNQVECDSQRQEEVETQSAARISSLLEIAKRHEQANTLRCLLANVDAMHPSGSDLEIQRWRSMVASEIERLDPLVDKRFLTVLEANACASKAA